jgi:hypothetical protein
VLETSSYDYLIEIDEMPYVDSLTQYAIGDETYRISFDKQATTISISKIHENAEQVPVASVSLAEKITELTAYPSNSTLDPEHLTITFDGDHVKCRLIVTRIDFVKFGDMFEINTMDIKLFIHQE